MSFCHTRLSMNMVISILVKKPLLIRLLSTALQRSGVFSRSIVCPGNKPNKCETCRWYGSGSWKSSACQINKALNLTWNCQTTIRVCHLKLEEIRWNSLDKLICRKWRKGVLLILNIIAYPFHNGPIPSNFCRRKLRLRRDYSFDNSIIMSSQNLFLTNSVTNIQLG